MDSLFTVWHAESQQAADEIILPDGCRDLILRQQQASRPDWFVSPLFDCATSVKVSADTRFVGYIIHPGAVISELSTQFRNVLFSAIQKCLLLSVVLRVGRGI